jgi:hypothetical protein
VDSTVVAALTDVISDVDPNCKASSWNVACPRRLRIMYMSDIVARRRMCHLRGGLSWDVMAFREVATETYRPKVKD